MVGGSVIDISEIDLPFRIGNGSKIMIGIGVSRRKSRGKIGGWGCRDRKEIASSRGVIRVDCGAA